MITMQISFLIWFFFSVFVFLPFSFFMLHYGVSVPVILPGNFFLFESQISDMSLPFSENYSKIERTTCKKTDLQVQFSKVYVTVL